MILKAALLVALATINIGPATNGRTIGVKPGAKIVLQLPQNPSTGYTWRILATPSPSLRLVSQRYVPSTLQLLGSPGNYVATWVAVKPGKVTLRLRYVRHTHPASQPAKTYRVTVVVR